jgi:hypothetical protein
MKIIKNTILSSILVTFALMLCSGNPCGSDAFLNSCAPELGDYTYINKFDIEVNEPGKKPEFSYVFSKGTTYRIVICDQGQSDNRMEVKLYDRDKKLIATNYLSSKKEYFPVLNYKCAATGVYYIESKFKPTKTGCGVVILGFSK